jgi:hypothetical protein
MALMKMGKLALLDGCFFLTSNARSCFLSPSQLTFGGGVIVSLKGPHEIGKGDPCLALMGTHTSIHTKVRCASDAEGGVQGSAAVAMSREVVFCLSVPRSTLFPLPANKNVKEKWSAEEAAAREHLRIIPGDLLQALGTFSHETEIAPLRAANARNKSLFFLGDDVVDEGDKEISNSAVLSLGSSTVVRAYQVCGCTVGQRKTNSLFIFQVTWNNYSFFKTGVNKTPVGGRS